MLFTIIDTLHAGDGALHLWRRRWDADRKSRLFMNMSILVVFLRSYIFIFSYDII